LEAVWIALGAVILVITFADTFFVVLNYDEAGIIVNRLMRAEWVVVRSITRRLSRRWRPFVLRQVTGVMLLSTIVSWILGIVLGFAFVYLGLIGLGAFQLSQGVTADFVGALYLSLGQFATVGADNISPAGGWINLVPVLEALMSVVMLSFIITYLSNIYSVIQLLRSLCADFFQTGPGVGSPVTALEPYFPDGEPRDVDRHLGELINDFNLYCDSLQQDHAAYLFQSGDEQFSLPFALHMTSGVVGALSFALPTGHAASQSPSLVRLRESFDGFRERRYRMMKWRTPVVPDAVDAERFAAAMAVYRAGTSRVGIDPWVLRFLTVNDDMATMTRVVEVDVDDAYRRYTAWLAFAYPAQQFVAAVARDLDFQPIYQGVAAAPEGDPSGAVEPAPPTRRRGGPIAWSRRRLLFLDPGSVRLGTALRTVGAVVAAVGIAVLASGLLGFHPTIAGVFAALIAVFCVPMTSGWGAGLMRSTGLLAIIPVAIGVAGGAFLPREPVWAIVGLAAIAAAAIWVGRFGPRWATHGRVAFVAMFFSLLLDVDRGELAVALVAAVIGVICSWLSNLLPLPGGSRQIRAGVDAVAERLVVLIDATVDVLSGLGDRRLRRVLRAENAALGTSVTALVGLLDPDPSGSAPGALRERRLQAFDLQLAVENLLRDLPDAADDAITVEERSRLAGELTTLQDRIRAMRLAPQEATALGPIASSTPTSPSARRVSVAIEELWSSASALLTATPVPEAALDAAPAASASGSASAPAAPRARTLLAVDAGTGRRAVQAGVATSLALVLASFVSTVPQYWAAMPAFQALSAASGESIAKTLQRLVGTVVGAAGAFGLALATDHDPIVAAVVVIVSVFLMSFLRPVASTWTALWQTVLLATAYDSLARLSAEGVMTRVLETAVGAAVALVVAALVLPTRTRARLLERMADFVATTAGVASAAVQRIADPGAVTTATPAALAAAEAEMHRRLDDVLGSAAGRRRDPGSLQRDGIETQLTSLTALAVSTHALVAAAVDAAPDDDATAASGAMTAAQWQRLDAATRDNFASTVAVLQRRLPTRVHDLRDVIEAATLTPEDPALSAIARVNETLLATMTALRPGSTDSAANPP